MALPVLPTCMPKATAALTVVAVAFLLMARGGWLLAKGRSWGFGPARPLLVAGDRRPSTVASWLLFGLGVLLVAASRVAYLAGNPGGSAPEWPFMLLSSAMFVGLLALLLPLRQGKAYSLRSSWYLLGGLVGFLLFFATVKTPCGTTAATLVFYGIALAVAGTGLRLWRLVGDGDGRA